MFKTPLVKHAQPNMSCLVFAVSFIPFYLFLFFLIIAEIIMTARATINILMFSSVNIIDTYYLKIACSVVTNQNTAVLKSGCHLIELQKTRCTIHNSLFMYSVNIMASDVTVVAFLLKTSILNYLVFVGLFIRCLVEKWKIKLLISWSSYTVN